MLSSTPVILCMMLLLAGSASAQPRPSQSEVQQGTTEFMALLARELMRMEEGELVVRAQPLARSVTQQAANALRLVEATSYRVIITRPEGKGMRLWVAVWVENMASQPWIPKEVTLSGRGEALKGAQVGEPRPIPPGEEGVVLVEAVATEAQSRGTFTLTLRDESGGQFITLGKVTFP